MLRVVFYTQGVEAPVWQQRSLFRLAEFPLGRKAFAAIASFCASRWKT